MKTTSYEIREQITDKYDDLQAIEITTGTNGYPEGLHGGVIGFDSIEEAEKVAKEFDGEVVEFRRRDGWQLWESRGIALKMYGLDRFKSSDDVDFRFLESEDDVENFFNEEVKSMLENGFSMVQIRDYMMPMQDILDEIDLLDEDEALKVNAYTPSEFETIAKKTMSYEEDVYQYVIGVELHTKED